MEGSPIHVVATDGALRRALVARLERAPELHDHVTGETAIARFCAGDVVVSTPTDCPPERAHELVRAGVAVIILAAIPRTEERQRYERAGVVAYIPMLIDGIDLVRAIVEALERGRGARTSCRSASA